MIGLLAGGADRASGVAVAQHKMGALVSPPRPLALGPGDAPGFGCTGVDLRHVAGWSVQRRRRRFYGLFSDPPHHLRLGLPEI
jgi:hypothetical protein